MQHVNIYVRGAVQKKLKFIAEKAGSDRFQKSAKGLLSALKVMSISQISTQKFAGQVISTHLKSQEKFVQ